MGQSSIIIHKGGKETKYEIYVEDYVLSFLKEGTDRLGLSELYFYGYQEKNGKKYTIYGAGLDKNLSVFDKYNSLDEIGCRLTQAGPAFFVKEKEGVYEIKGYEVFYQDNLPMQSYLIDQRNERLQADRNSQTEKTDRNFYSERNIEQKIIAAKMKKEARSEMSHNTISIQLGVIFVALVAIVINSTNSYEKMEQLNQSASEVFFAMENQEAEDVIDAAEGLSEIVVQRDRTQDNDTQQGLLTNQTESNAGQEDILKLVTLENENQEEEKGDLSVQDEENLSDITGSEDDGGKAGQGEEPQSADDEEQSRQQEEDEDQKGKTVSEEEEGLEALSRSVTRYYEVEKGDTLYTISQKIYGDSSHVQKICELNQITNPDNIRYGQKIILP